jgi:hypothetical protein
MNGADLYAIHGTQERTHTFNPLTYTAFAAANASGSLP